MNGFLLLIPFLLVRFGLLALLDREAVGRAAHFAPMSGGEIPAYWVYQISTAAIFIYLCFCKIAVLPLWLFGAGLAVYLLGLLACGASIVSFAAPSGGGPLTKGVYRFSRNPMYGAYFLLFLGCALLTQSPALGGIVLVFQISAHWIILAEERWCLERFGDAYRQYMDRVRRYL